MRKFATLLACFGLTAAAGCTNDQTTDDTEAPVTGKTADPGALGTDTEGTTPDTTDDSLDMNGQEGTMPESDTDRIMPESGTDTLTPDTTTPDTTMPGTTTPEGEPQGMQNGAEMEDPSAMTPPRAGETGAMRSAELGSQPSGQDPVARLAIIEIDLQRLQGTAPRAEVSKLEKQHEQAKQRVRTAEKAVEDLEKAVDRAESKSQQQGTQPTEPQPGQQPGMQQPPTEPQPGQQGTQPETQPQPGQQGTNY